MNNRSYFTILGEGAIYLHISYINLFVKFFVEKIVNTKHLCTDTWNGGGGIRLSLRFKQHMISQMNFLSIKTEDFFKNHNKLQPRSDSL